MLHNLLFKKDHARNSPFLDKKDVAAVECADSERRLSKAIDEKFLAQAAYRQLVKAPLTQGADGQSAYRTDGTVVTRWETQKALRRLEEADAEYIQASEHTAAARGKLARLEASHQEWLRRGDFEADQARQRAAETPSEKAAREYREMEQVIRAVPR